jgi:sulfhydrogenase subunit alpha
VEIQVEHLTRVEGHGSLHARVVDGRVEEVSFRVVEANRFFEGILRGHDAEEVAHIASRICGICAISHSCASLQASERALGIEVSEQTTLLRRLIMNAEVISSHALHVYFLAAPDFLKRPSVLPLIGENPELVKLAFRVKKAGYDLGEAVVGRHTHPVSAVPGGFTEAPKPWDLERMRGRLVTLRPDLEATVELFGKLEVPQFARPTEYVSLHRHDHYSFYGGEIVSSEGASVDAQDYLDAIRESVVAGNYAKLARWNRDTYMAGALARVNNNWRQLHPAAQEAMEALGLRPPCHHPFRITAAQVVELVHCAEDSIALIEQLLARGIEPQQEPEITPRAGRGVGVVEAPRGLLIHDYTYDEEGRCTAANCIIPTNQNAANINADLQAYLPQILDLPEHEVKLRLEMLVRAYDPCISCSVH